MEDLEPLINSTVEILLLGLAYSGWAVCVPVLSGVLLLISSVHGEAGNGVVTERRRRRDSKRRVFFAVFGFLLKQRKNAVVSVTTFFHSG